MTRRAPFIALVVVLLGAWVAWRALRKDFPKETALDSSAAAPKAQVEPAPVAPGDEQPLAAAPPEEEPAAATPTTRVEEPTAQARSERRRYALADFRAQVEAWAALRKEPASGPEDGSGAAGTTLDELRAPTFELLAAKYATFDEAAMARARATLADLLEWQENGPFDSESERLSKPMLEALMLELEWLREQGVR